MEKQVLFIYFFVQRRSSLRGNVIRPPLPACERASKAIGGKRVSRLPILLALMLLLTSPDGLTLAPSAAVPDSPARRRPLSR